VWKVVATADPTHRRRHLFRQRGSDPQRHRRHGHRQYHPDGERKQTPCRQWPGRNHGPPARCSWGPNNTGTINLNVLGGTLVDNNPWRSNAGSDQCRATGRPYCVRRSGEPHQHRLQGPTGASTFANGAQGRPNFLSLQTAPVETYTILQTTGFWRPERWNPGWRGSGQRPIPLYRRHGAPLRVRSW